MVAIPPTSLPSPQYVDGFVIGHELRRALCSKGDSPPMEYDHRNEESGYQPKTVDSCSIAIV